MIKSCPDIAQISINEEKTAQEKEDKEEEFFERCIEFEAPEVLLLGSEHNEAELKILQKWDSDESGVVWDASLLLAKYLERIAAKKASSSKKKLFQNATAIELGSGTGFLGLWLAAMGARVLLTDLPTNLDLLGRNLKLNAAASILDESLVKIAAFDWLDKSQRQTKNDFLDWTSLKDIDYWIVSDCLYYKEGIQAIYELLDWVLGDLQTKATFLISYEDREDKAEMIMQFLLMIRHNPALECTEIPVADLHPDFHSPDLHLLQIVAANKK